MEFKGTIEEISMKVDKNKKEFSKLKIDGLTYNDFNKVSEGSKVGDFVTGSFKESSYEYDGQTQTSRVLETCLPDDTELKEKYNVDAKATQSSREDSMKLMASQRNALTFLEIKMKELELKGEKPTDELSLLQQYEVIKLQFLQELGG